MQQAAERGHWPIIEYLISLNSRQRGFFFDQREACLTAAARGHVSVVLRLTSRLYASDGSVGYDTGDLFFRAIDAAAEAGRCEVLSALIDGMNVVKYFDPDHGIYRGQCQPLIFAATGRHVPAVEYLIKKGFRMDEVDEEGNTPLLMAAMHGHANVVRCLLENKADPSVTNGKDEDAWDLAWRHRETDVLKILASKVGDLGSKLLAVARRGGSGVVSALLKARADANTYSSDSGDTPLLLAAKRVNVANTVRTIKLLLKYGADIDMRNAEGQTALIAAANNGRIHAFHALLDGGADLTVCDNNGQTALMRLAVDGRPRVIKKVLSCSRHFMRQKKTQEHNK